HSYALSPSRGCHMLAFANLEGLVAGYDMMFWMEPNAGPTFTWETVIIGDLMQLLYNLRVFVCISQPMASKLFAYGPVKATMDCCSYFRVTVNLGTFGAESRMPVQIVGTHVWLMRALAALNHNELLVKVPDLIFQCRRSAETAVVSQLVIRHRWTGPGPLLADSSDVLRDVASTLVEEDSDRRNDLPANNQGASVPSKSCAVNAFLALKDFVD
ncbi:unnamed protein product, partial [Symbiodinium microadriaticum]